MRVRIQIDGDHIPLVEIDDDEVHADYIFEFDTARNVVDVVLDIPGIEATTE